MSGTTIPAFIFFLVTILVFPPSVSFGEGTDVTQVVETEGSAQISGGDLARARNEAVRDALQKAVAQMASRWLLLLESDKQSQKLNERIIDRAEGFIQDYRIVSERSGPDYYAVIVRATVFADSIRIELQGLDLIMQKQAKLPVSTISLTIRGIRAYSDYAKWRGILKDGISGVRDIAFREASWGSARFDIAAEGAVGTITEQLQDKFRADIRPLDERMVEINLK